MSEVSTRYVYYFEGEELDEDDMPETFIQDELSTYLVELFNWYFRFQNHVVRGNINIYRKGHYNERVAPDVMIIKNIGVSYNQLRKLKSYAIDPPKFPPPTVAIDLAPDKKPTRYGELGVKEYFAFDPEDGKNIVKLSGWRYIDGLRTEIQPDGRGWLWSNELECWLVADGMILRFYDKEGKMLLTKGEAEEIAKLAERQAKEEAERRAEAERLAKEKAENAAEMERRAKVEAERLAEAERQIREELERKIAELQAKLDEKEHQ
jgi:Uma2 family endonuclease